MTGDTLGVPGLLMFSTTPDGDDERHVKIVTTDQRSPLAERWGGWFVTGKQRRGARIVATRCRRSTGIRAAASPRWPDSSTPMDSAPRRATSPRS